MSAAVLVARIAELERMLAGSGITVLTLTEAGETITLRRDAAPSAEAAPSLPSTPAPPVPGLSVTASCPGVFLLRHPLRDEPLAVPGQAVTAGTVLGLLRAGPLLVAVAAPVAGVLLAVEAAEGDLVGYGTPLFRLHPETEAP